MQVGKLKDCLKKGTRGVRLGAEVGPQGPNCGEPPSTQEQEACPHTVGAQPGLHVAGSTWKHQGEEPGHFLFHACPHHAGRLAGHLPSQPPMCMQALGTGACPR